MALLQHMLITWLFLLHNLARANHNLPFVGWRPSFAVRGGHQRSPDNNNNNSKPCNNNNNPTSTNMSESAAEPSSNDLLPSVIQEWVHAVDTKETLLKAVAENSTITAIETDVVMGHVVMNSSTTTTPKIIPIMAHPPNTQSDLPMTDFLDIIMSRHSDTHHVRQVIKLDFKELETVEPTLQAIVVQKKLQTADNGIFLLNADILEGPGHRGDGAVTIPASVFLETCLRYIRGDSSITNTQTTTLPRFAFSLGFKADCTSTQGYSAGDVETMSELIRRYQLLPEESTAADSPGGQWIGVVLALNARQLVRSMDHFDSIMKRFPDLQILVWTGKGEPAVPRTSIDAIRHHFGTALASRIGFDCQVNEKYWSGMATDYLVVNYGYYKRATSFLSGK